MSGHKVLRAPPLGQAVVRPTVGDIFRRYGAEYRQSYSLTPDQSKVLHAIETCRTAALGGHRRVCDSCGSEVLHFNSCRNRHCPGCQALPQALWIARREERILPVQYFHVVFTQPAELRPLVYRNPRKLYALLLRSAAQTLLELGRDPNRLGAQLGVTTVLHTWTRELGFHPHAHCVVTAGGLAMQGSPRWIHLPGEYLFPVQVMGQLFRGKYLSGLRALYEAGKLRVPRSVKSDFDGYFKTLLDKLYDMDWNVYSKAPFAGAKQVFQYLGQYTHRVAISNHRILRCDEDGVCFKTRDGKSITLPPQIFIRRFLMHVLPRGFVKIRHYGLMASGNVNTRLALAQRLLAPPGGSESESESKPLAESGWEEVLFRLTGINLGVCRNCGSTNIRRCPILRSRSPPQEGAWVA